MKNRANTEQKIIKAVDDILNTNGFRGLGINKVAKQAGVSKILIYRYFGNFQRLLKRCVIEKYFWVNHPANSAMINCNSTSLKGLLESLLKEQFDSFFRHCETEALILNTIAGENKIVNNLFNNIGYDEEMDEMFLHQSADSNTYYKIVSRLLVAGTTQLVLEIPAIEDSGRYLSRIQQQERLQQSIAQILLMSSLV